MKHTVVLTIASLLSILLGTFHLADDVARGMSPGGLLNLVGIVIFVVWLYGTIVLAGRRSGYIIILVASLLSAGVPVIHMRGVGMGFGTIRSGGFFFVWTLLALGVTALFSVILSVQGLWSLRRGEPR
ncbi:MAG TPA: hypothetical protein VNG89_25740 [Vicinamibacterales bacterium]|nr:hypothetical protein [Vicinamibacterales bacterium]